MTKAELEKDRDEWKQQAESLQDELDALDEAYTELEKENFDLSNDICGGIKDIDRFIYRLKLEDLWTDELGDFLENYLKFHNN